MGIINSSVPITQDEGVTLGAKLKFNFSGAGVVATNNSDQGRMDIIIAGGGGTLHALDHRSGGADPIGTYLAIAAIPTIPAGLVGTGIFEVGRVPTIPTGLVGTGQFGLARMPDGTATYVLTAQGVATIPYWASPGAPGAHAETHRVGGTDAIATYLNIAAIPTINATLVGTGVFEVGRIPTINANLVGIGVFEYGRLPTIAAGLVGTGVLEASRIPTINANLIGAGLLDYARLPTIAAGLVATGQLSINRMPEGSSGDVLTAQGIGTVPVFQALGAPGLHSTTHRAGGTDAIATYIDFLAMPTISAQRVGTGIFEYGRLPTIAAGLVGTGVFEYARIPTIAAGLVGTGVFESGRIPTISATFIGSDRLSISRLPYADANLFLQGIGSGLDPTYGAAPAAAAHATSHRAGGSDAIATYIDFLAIPTISAQRVGTGVFEAGRIPTIDAALIGTGIFAYARIPTIAAGLVGTGVFEYGRLPTIAAGLVGTGILGIARIPTIPAALVGTGQLAIGQMTDGTTSYVLTGQGVGTPPYWAAVGAPGAHATTLRAGGTDAVATYLDFLSIPTISAQRVGTGIFEYGRLPTISAGLVGTGVLEAGRIPTISANLIGSDILAFARIPTISAQHVATGVLNIAQMSDGTTSYVLTGQGVGTPPYWAALGAPGIHSTTHRAGGSDAIATYLDFLAIPTISAGGVGTGVFEAGRIPTIDAALLGSGLIAFARIPTISAQIVGTGVFNLAQVPTMDAAHIIEHDAAKINSGIFAFARIPTISGQHIATGILDYARIPTIAAGLVGTGQLSINQMTDGTTSYVLTGQGVGTPPTWGAAGAPGAHATTHRAGGTDAIATYLDFLSIPTISAQRVGTGVFEAGRIPTIDAALLGSGIVAYARIGTLAADNVGTGVLNTARIATNARLFGVTMIFDGGGTLVGSGTRLSAQMPLTGTIIQATLLGDALGSLIVNIYKNTYTNWPTVAVIGTIALGNVQKNQDSTLTGWTLGITEGDVLEAYSLNGASGVNRVSVSLKAVAQ